MMLSILLAGYALGLATGAWAHVVLKRHEKPALPKMTLVYLDPFHKDPK